ncbi:hypothetical protein Vadar_028434 [Vaccinium darrowii]|uniref:Uncharacterized protein n=1 Tax=Vaccinium darrowii TaxID=229202 RepID=A0ACB7YA44_9ERIC|nr:hypothetical protein Vadar_028434 [Vaccinium darrowii]
MFVPYFQNLFEGTFCKNGMEVSTCLLLNGEGSYEGDGSSDWATVLLALNVRLSEDQVRGLELSSTEGEVCEAVFQMKGSKALGLDGFVAWFYQKNWNWVGEDVVRMVLAFLHSENNAS